MNTVDPQTSSTTAFNQQKEVDYYQRAAVATIVEFLLIAGCIAAVTIAILYYQRTDIIIYAVASILLMLYLIVLNKSNESDRRRIKKKQDNKIKAELYASMSGEVANGESLSPTDLSINMMRERAIRYCQELIDDYKKVRVSARNGYYFIQISTIVLSGVTPILVLLDKLETTTGWTKWLPVVFPAIASIFTSISTSFPFEEKWVRANATVELLEAEQEKFILGVTKAYRLYDLPEASQRRQKVHESVESFIKQVNVIHLSQVQQSAEETTESEEKNKAKEKESA